MPDNLLPAAVITARAACAALTDAQRLVFAIELARDVTDDHCILSLRRLETMATETAHNLAKVRFARECV